MKDNISELFKIVEFNGGRFRLGASVREVGPGDLVKLASVHEPFAIIDSIDDPDGFRSPWVVYDTRGRTYLPIQIAAYGKKVVKT